MATPASRDIEACDTCRLKLASGPAPGDETPTALGQYPQALEHRQKAVAVPEPPDLAEALSGIGRSQVALHAPDKALAPLEHALTLAASPRLAPETAADIRFGLARALWETHGDKARARKLAAEARDAYAQAGRPQDVSAVAAWLAAR